MLIEVRGLRHGVGLSQGVERQADTSRSDAEAIGKIKYHDADGLPKPTNFALLICFVAHHIHHARAVFPVTIALQSSSAAMPP
ncbi:hypothetical protein PQR53_09200 [Paraburkholderia fungorum]|uniref:hypothetical protein n=1 Tax=Paraburkholderia fungorum TaxID=134537 RepID=UPI0038B6D900